MNTDYEKQSRDFLTKHNISFKAVFKGDKCPLWDDPKHIHGDRYLITLKRDKRQYSFSFWNKPTRQARREYTHAICCTDLH